MASRTTPVALTRFRDRLTVRRRPRERRREVQAADSREELRQKGVGRVHERDRRSVVRSARPIPQNWNRSSKRPCGACWLPVRSFSAPRARLWSRKWPRYCGAGLASVAVPAPMRCRWPCTRSVLAPATRSFYPPFTFFATAGASRRTGARPGLRRHRSAATYNSIRYRSRTRSHRAPARLSPSICSASGPIWNRLWRIAGAERSDPIIEDAAQAMGAEYQRNVPGSWCGLGCLSFYPTKTSAAYGDARHGGHQ